MELVDKKEIKLAVIIPAFNEEETIGSVIRSIPRNVENVSEVSVILVNDGSQDHTVFEAQNAGADHVVDLRGNHGVGYAFKAGITKALEIGATVIVNLDADGQHDPNDISRLIRPISEEGYDVVVGSRFLENSELKMPLLKRLGNRFFTKIVSWSIGQHLTDCQSGFRAISREAALRLNIIGKFTYTQESLIELAIKNLRITEVPIKVKPRNGQSKVVKNCYSYGFKALAIMLRSLRDFKPLAFFGSIGALLFLTGFSSGLFVIIHWLLNGRTSPYTSLIDFTVLSCLAGVFVIVLALMSDMQVRQRRIQEECLYFIKLLRYDKKSKGSNRDMLKDLESLPNEFLMRMALELDKHE